MDLFPDDFRVFITDKENKVPVRNIAVKVTLFATRKNDYHLFPGISDDNGNIIFTKEWLSEEIEKERNLFLMDYACRLNDCLPQIRIEDINEADVNKAVYGMNLFKEYFKYSSEEIDMFAKVDNKDYKPTSQTITFSGGKSVAIEIELEKKLS